MNPCSVASDMASEKEFVHWAKKVTWIVTTPDSTPHYTANGHIKQNIWACYRPRPRDGFRPGVLTAGLPEKVFVGIVLRDFSLPLLVLFFPFGAGG